MGTFSWHEIVLKKRNYVFASPALLVSSPPLPRVPPSPVDLNKSLWQRLGALQLCGFQLRASEPIVTTHPGAHVHSHTHTWTHCAVFSDRTLCVWVLSQVETFRPGKVRRLLVQIPAGGTCKLKINPSVHRVWNRSNAGRTTLGSRHGGRGAHPGDEQPQ